MRPLKLQVQGWTSYKQPIEVDFTQLDLFAITGPTGAGKSSIVDAMTYALFGQVPRVGRNIKELISQGEDRLRVSLDFAKNGDSFRIIRSTARRGQSPIQMERLDAASGDWVPEADRARDANAEIERLLGLDYDGFVRSVLLPQGQFQQFLAGEPDQRRRVLDGLLRLDVYQIMQRRANQISAERKQEADAIAQLLGSQFATATAGALKEAKQRLKELKARSSELAALRTALETVCQKSEALSQARARRETANAALAAAEAGLEKAKELLTTGEKEVEALKERKAQTEAVIAANSYDADVHNRLSQAQVLAQQLERAEKSRSSLEERVRLSAKELETAQQEEARAGLGAKAAAADLQAARTQLDAERRRDVAAGLRRGLRPGDPCPVCGQKTGALPAEDHPVLAEAEAALERAQQAEESARSGLQDTRQACALASQALEIAKKQQSEAEEEHRSARQRLIEALGGKDMDVATVAAEVKLQETARQERQRLAEEERTLAKQITETAAAIASAGKEVARLESERSAAQRDIEAATTQVAEAESALRSEAEKKSWKDIADTLDAGDDPSPLLRDRLRSAQTESDGAQKDIGGCENEIKQIEEAMQRAEGMKEQEQAARHDATLARDLASLLGVNQFQAFIRSQALRILAEDGSRQLRALSGDRYDFCVESQEFFIVDHWNGDESRSVKTLSGGETFLASLALALALAERLPDLSGGVHSAALESLFIDEGFSYLDEQTLDTVANALEALRAGGERLVGVITHLPALAERMPARITVVKSESGSTLAFDQ